MKTLTVRTTIAPDGTIDLRIPSDLPPGHAEVVVVVQPLGDLHPGPPFLSDEGVWAGKLPDIDIDADLKDMNQLWEQRMDLLE